MKKILFLMTLLFFIAADAQAQESKMNFYGRVLAGVNFLQNAPLNKNNPNYDTGYLVEGSLGYCWGCGLRLEGEYGYRRNALKKLYFPGQGYSKNGHLQTFSCMTNLLWDLPLPSWGCSLWNLRPFVGAGLGYDFQQMHASNSRIHFHQKWKHFSWQLMTGFAYEIFCHTELSLEYKFHQGGCRFNNHSIGVGLLYKFGLFR